MFGYGHVQHLVLAPSGVVAVIPTHDRAALLRRCLMAVFTQACVPDHVLVIDNASGAAAHDAVLEFPRAEHIRLDVNVCAGMQAALTSGAAFMWLMDEDDPRSLAFPLRIGRRTLFKIQAAQARGAIDGFAHLFNGALMGGDLVRRIGLPDPCFCMRGDGVEFRARARRVNRASPCSARRNSRTQYRPESCARLRAAATTPW